MRYPTCVEDLWQYYEFPDYVIDDYTTSAGHGIFGIIVEYHSDLEEYYVYGSDQDGGEHDLKDYIDYDTIVKLINNYNKLDTF